MCNFYSGVYIYICSCGHGLYRSSHLLNIKKRGFLAITCSGTRDKHPNCLLEAPNLLLENTVSMIPAPGAGLGMLAPGADIGMYAYIAHMEPRG